MPPEAAAVLERIQEHMDRLSALPELIRQEDRIHREVVLKQVSVSETDGSVEFTGYAATWDEDSVYDTIEKGAFEESIQEFGPKGTRQIKLLWQHRDLVGVVEDLREDAIGVFIKGRILPTSLGKDVGILLRGGALDRMSIGFSLIEFTYNNETERRNITKARMWEASLVNWPANEKAIVTSVKTMLGEMHADILEIKSLMTPVELEPLVTALEVPVPEVKLLPEVVEEEPPEVKVGRRISAQTRKDIGEILATLEQVMQTMQVAVGQCKTLINMDTENASEVEVEQKDTEVDHEEGEDDPQGLTLLAALQGLIEQISPEGSTMRKGETHE